MQSKIILLTVIFFFFTNDLLSQVKLFEINPSSQTIATVSPENTLNLFLIDNMHDSIVDNRLKTFQIDLPFFNTNIILDLNEFNLIDSNFIKVKSIHENFTEELAIIPEVISYELRSSEEILGVLNFVNGEIVGAFRYDNKQYELTRHNGGYVLFESNNSINQSNFQCHVQDESNSTKNVVYTSEMVNNVCIEFAVEIDNYTRQTFNTDQEAINWATAIFAGVSQIYESQTSASLTIVEFIIWNAPDPYVNLFDTQSILYEMQNYWIDNNSNINRDLAHLMSKRPLGGGIAFVDALCSDNWGFGFSADLNNNTSFDFPNPTYTWNLGCVAHEIGHNIGSNHTHNCNWNSDIALAFNGGPIDNCVDVEGNCANNPQAQIGTIMSYCHLNWNGGIILDFHPVVLSQALNPGIQNASCLAPCLPATWDCINGSCVERSDGSGEYNSIDDCSNSCICTQNEVVLDFLPDCYGVETSWELINEDGQVLFSVSGYPGGSNANEMNSNPEIDQHIWCLEDGCYTFTVYDSYGDGMNGANPEYQCGQDGDYNIYNGNTIEASLQNANFGESVSNEFCVEQAMSASWNCVNESCIDPGDGSGQYNTLQACLNICQSSTNPSWNCLNSNCIDPGDGSGLYNTTEECWNNCHSTNNIQERSNNILIYPNPSNGIFTIEVDEVIYKLSIYDYFGKEITAYKLSKENDYKFLLNLSKNSRGLYFIHLFTENEFLSNKIIIQ